VDHEGQEQVALHRWAVIAEAAGPKLTPAERGALARQIAARAHAHPDGSSRRYSRGTIDRWLRAWRRGGLDALKPSPRADTGVVRAHLWVPRRSSTSCGQVVFVDHAADLRVPSDTVLPKIDRFR